MRPASFVAKAIAGSTVVITGATSGIGRAAALAFARQGASLVLGARREFVLGELATECQELGAQALASPIDVADEGSLRELAKKAYATFGAIDVWISNAGVGLFGRFCDAPMDDHKRVLETNLFGAMYGAAAALPYLTLSHGVLINNACGLVASGAPYASSYSAAAAGIRAFSASLRQELRTNGMHVCTVLPGAVDTPFYRHAANFTGRTLRPPARPRAAIDVAEALIACVRHPRAESFVGRPEAMAGWLHALLPEMAERLASEEVEQDELQEGGQPLEIGNLYEPVHEGRLPGGGYLMPKHSYTVRRQPRSRLAAVSLALAAALRRR